MVIDALNMRRACEARNFFEKKSFKVSKRRARRTEFRKGGHLGGHFSREDRP